MTNTQVDIAIVGAGMVGGALASSLKDTGYSIALIDAQDEENLARSLKPASEVNDFEARVSALTFASRDLLKKVGAWDRIANEQKLAYRDMHVWDKLGTASIDFSAAELYQDELGYIIENQSIVSAIHQSLESQENLQCFFGSPMSGVEVISDQAALSDQAVSSDKTTYQIKLANEQTVQCSLLVAADGANSRVRNWLNMATREWDYQHHAIVATVKTEKPHQKTAWQCFSESGPVALLPLQDANQSDQFCSIVWSQTPERAKSLMALSDSEFCQALTKETEASLGEVLDVSVRYSIPLRQRHAKDYVKEGVVLVGDAAHTIHPLAGQGVNLGFKDVAALSALLNKASEDELAANNALYLSRFQRQRQGDNLLMMGAMEGFKRLFAQPDPIVRWIRNAGLNFVNKQSLIKNQLAKHAMGLPLA